MRGKTVTRESKTKDFASYKDKPATELQQELAAWICEKTGYDPATAKSKQQAFLDGIRLGASLRMEHQASPENQASILRRRKAAEERAIAKSAALPAAKEAPEGAEAPRRRPGKVAKAAAPAPEAKAEPVKAAAPRRRPAKATAEAPF